MKRKRNKNNMKLKGNETKEKRSRKKTEKDVDQRTDVCSPAEPPGSERIPIVALVEPGRRWNCAAFHDSHTCTKTKTHEKYKHVSLILSVISPSVSLHPTDDQTDQM